MVTISKEKCDKLKALCGIDDVEAYIDSIINASEESSLEKEFNAKTKAEKVNLLKGK